MSSVIAMLKRRWAARIRSAITRPSPAARYANQLIRDEPCRFDAIEVHGIRQFTDATNPARSYCEIDHDHPEFFSVYLHCVGGGVCAAPIYQRAGTHCAMPAPSPAVTAGRSTTTARQHLATRANTLRPE